MQSSLCGPPLHWFCSVMLSSFVNLQSLRDWRQTGPRAHQRTHSDSWHANTLWALWGPCSLQINPQTQVLIGILDPHYINPSQVDNQSPDTCCSANGSSTHFQKGFHSILRYSQGMWEMVAMVEAVRRLGWSTVSLPQSKCPKAIAYNWHAEISVSGLCFEQPDSPPHFSSFTSHLYSLSLDAPSKLP